MVKLATLVLSALLATQTPGRDAPQEPVGTATLSGIVTSTDAGRPLSRATVSLTGGRLVSPRVTGTDREGRFSFDGLAAGQYALSVSRAAYVTMTYGATRPRRQGTSIVLTDGQRLAGLVVALPPGAVITGTVVNATGDPISGIEVSTLQWLVSNGERQLVSAGAAGSTDDRGQYRLYGLDAGDYLVVAEQTDPRGPADIVQLTDADVDRALQQTRPLVAPAPLSPSVAGKPPVAVTPRVPATPPVVAAPQRVGFAPVFYPGTAKGAEALRVTLGAGEERSGVDIRAQMVPMASVDGTVTTGDGRPATGGMVVLTPRGAPAPDRTFYIGGRLGPKTLGAGGRFTFVGVPPGDYVLTATSMPAQFDSRVPIESSVPRTAFTTLTIDGDDRSVALTLQPGMTMSGRVAFEGAAAPPKLAGARVTLEEVLVGQPGFDRLFSAEAGADGTFQLSGLTPGRFVLAATPPMSGWALASVRTNGRELLDAPFELKINESLSDVLVTFTARPSELAGTLQASSGAPTADYFIVVFATDRAFWFPNSRRIASVRPTTTGRYSVRNLPAGEYFIAAVTDVEVGEWFDPAFLELLVAGPPLKIRLGSNETTTQDLRISR